MRFEAKALAARAYDAYDGRWASIGPDAIHVEWAVADGAAQANLGLQASASASLDRMRVLYLDVDLLILESGCGDHGDGGERCWWLPRVHVLAHVQAP